MTDLGFTTSAEAHRRKLAEAERRVERTKRALEAYILANGFASRDPVGRYCRAVGIEVRISAGAGAEFTHAGALTLDQAIEDTPIPDALRRYCE